MATETEPIARELALFASTVRAAVAPMHAEPRIASPMISQQLAGHRVEVVEEEAEWVRARGADGYDGWMHRGFLLRADDAGRADSRSRMSLGCVARNGTESERALPLRALLAAGDVAQSGEVADLVELPRLFPPGPAAITASARRFFHGTSYLWGGVTPWGADCSGLVQSVFALHGTQLPRDAWQQAEVGTDAGSDIDAFREGDLLFFSDRDDQRVTHVGISLGGAGMVHLALGRGGYAIERLDDDRDAYVAKLRERLRCARRLG